jgi:predicted AAA+ superfamily ATPase
MLEQTFMVRLLQPLEPNLAKRLTKTPKIYLRDSGIVHELLEIDRFDVLAGHPAIGASWEGWCIEQIAEALPGWRASFCRTTNGEEVDLIMDRGRVSLAFEFKTSSAPELTRGGRNLLDDLKPKHTWLVAPLAKGWPVNDGITVASIGEVLAQVQPYR